MKHLKSSISDLRRIFEENITVRYLAQPFVFFDESCAAAEVRTFMDPPRDYDVVGVRKDGLIEGYVNREDLGPGVLNDYLKPFEPDLLLDESASIRDALRLLCEPPHRVYVQVIDRVSGIVTKGDLQKLPVRMWLFGLISLIEMQFLRLIRGGWPDESWKELISPDQRLVDAQKMLDNRQSRNEKIDLADCLQFCDKREIVLENDKLRTELGFKSKGSGEKTLTQLENLRNNLDHAQDILEGSWRELFNLVVAAEDILDRAERIDEETAKKLCTPTAE